MFWTYRTTRLLLAALCACVVPAVSSEPLPGVAKIIEQRALREAARPMSEMPGWQPRRIVVSVPVGMGLDVEGYKAMMSRAAGDVELVFNESPGFGVSADVMAGADALVGVCTPANLAAAGAELRWIHNFFVGMDRCKGWTDEQRKNVTFTNSQRLSAPTIAEHTIAMLLSLTRNFPAYHAAQAEGRWAREVAGAPSFGELSDKTLLVVGLGGIGTEIARRAHGLGMRVIATRNSSREGPDFVDYVGLSDELLKLASEADVVANALPLTEKTTGLFDAAFFEAVKPGAIFLSVGRGKSTVTADLLAALESGQLFGAGLDVTDPEPLPAESPLWNMPKVIITPHISATGGGSFQRTLLIAAENLRRYVAGERMLNVVDISRGY